MAAVCLAMAACLAIMGLPKARPASVAEAEITKEEGTENMAISAYVFDRADLTLRDEDAARLTQMNYSFGLIKDGKVSGSHWKSIDAFKAYTAAHPNILPVLAVGGWGADGFSQAAATQESRDVFVKSAMDLMAEDGFLGIDIDWEYPGSSVAGIASSPEDAQNLLLLLRELRAALDEKTAADGKKRLLSIAVGGSGQYAGSLDCEVVAGLVDQVNVMTYDLRGSEKVAGHHTSLYPQQGGEDISVDSAISAFAAAGIPREKLMLGAAFYGRAWREVKSTENNGLGQKAGTPGNKSYGFDTLMGLLADGKYTRYWDSDAMAPYLFNGSTFISYDDPESVTLKAQYAKESGLMGVMFWEYGQDHTGTLLKALYDAAQ